MKILCLAKTDKLNTFVAMIDPFYAGGHIHEVTIAFSEGDEPDSNCYVFDTYAEAYRYAEAIVYAGM